MERAGWKTPFLQYLQRQRVEDHDLVASGRQLSTKRELTAHLVTKLFRLTIPQRNAFYKDKAKTQIKKLNLKFLSNFESKNQQKTHRKVLDYLKKNVPDDTWIASKDIEVGAYYLHVDELKQLLTDEKGSWLSSFAHPEDLGTKLELFDNPFGNSELVAALVRLEASRKSAALSNEDLTSLLKDRLEKNSLSRSKPDQLLHLADQIAAS